MSGSIIPRVLKDGKTRAYECRIRVNGKQKSKTFKLKKHADQYIARHSTDAYDGIARPLKKAKFEKFIEHWKETYLIPEKLKPSTINGYASILSKHIVKEFEGYQMTAISKGDIKSFEARLLKDGLSKQSVKGILILLKKIFADAVEEGDYLRISPMIGLKPTKVENAVTGRALKADEVRKLLAQCDDKLRPIVLIALLGGLRRAEVFALHWTDDKKNSRSCIDFEANVIHVRQSIFFRWGSYQTRREGEPSWIFQPPKSESSIRDVPLSPHLRRELLALRLRSTDKHGLIFQTSTGNPMDANNVCGWRPRKQDDDQQHDMSQLPSSSFARAVKQADIGPVRFHDLRHSYGSHKLDAGARIYDVQKWMGHASIQVTIDIYGHPTVDNGAEAAAKTDAFLGLTETAVAAD